MPPAAADPAADPRPPGGGRRLRVLTWHVHGTYLWYLSHCGHELLLPVRDDRRAPWHGRGGTFPWPATVREIPAAEVRDAPVDVVLTQSVADWREHRHQVLSPAQLALPRVHVEHDPPRRSPTDEPHPVDDPGALLVHVTHYNRLMWDSGRTPTTVIEHGVAVPEDLRATYELPRAVTAVNDLATRGRRLGPDVFAQVRSRVPVDLYGMGADRLGGIGELDHAALLAREARYRAFFNPIRHTSLGLAVCEAMAIGLPVVGLATTELASVVDRDVNGWIDTDVTAVAEQLARLVEDPDRCRRLGEGARRTARQRFGIERFAADWDRTLRAVVDRGPTAAAEGGPAPGGLAALAGA